MMNAEEFKNLKTGDLVEHAEGGPALQIYSLTPTGEAIAIRIEKVKYPEDWILVKKAAGASSPAPKSREYVVGFAFDESKEFVLLVKKKRPDWQAGKLNGPGGEMRRGESPAGCMAREFREETGIDTNESEWQQFAQITGDGWKVHCFRMFRNGPVDFTIQGTDEQILWLPVHYVLKTELFKRVQYVDQLIGYAKVMENGASWIFIAHTGENK